MDDLADFMESRESVKIELAAVEAKLALQMGFTGPARLELLKLSRRGELKETPLVREWYALYAAHKDWLADAADTPPAPTPKKASKRAAVTAALSLFVSSPQDGRPRCRPIRGRSATSRCSTQGC